MPETVIVTVRYGREEYDFELPARIAVENWIESFLANARVVFAGFLIQGRNAEFRCDGILIKPQYSLEQCGIFDGRILEVYLV